MATSAVIFWQNTGIKPVYDDAQAKVQNVRLPANVTYAAGTVLGELVGNDAVQSITLSTSGTLGGTYTLTYLGETTSALAFNSTALQVQEALEALSTIGVGNMLVSGTTPGTSGGVLDVTFSNKLGKQAITAMTASGTSLTGSGSSVSIATVTAGASGTPGTFAQCVYTNSDGSQTAKAVLQFQSATDSNGNITFGGAPTGGEFGQTDIVAPAYFSGTFNTADLPNLTEQMMASLNARYVSGSIANGGVVRIP